MNKLPIRVAECCKCGAYYSPLLSALNIGRYARKEANFEHEVIEAVTDKIKQLIGIELPEGDYEILKEEDNDEVKSKYESSKTQVKELIETFRERGYEHFGLTQI